MSRYLVTGGAGYIGSHLVQELVDLGEEVVVVDNLTTGHQESLSKNIKFYIGNVGDSSFINYVLSRGTYDAVFHFASRSIVNESMRQPFLYLNDNVRNSLILIETCIKYKIPKFVFSSTAALFGSPNIMPITEECCIIPGSPYGEGKLMVENILKWADEIYGFRSACLRYFNAAGCDPLLRLGEDHRPETHLIPLVIDAAINDTPISIFGDDYPTLDGTCIRDYIHVTDLADAHIRVLDLINNKSVRYNLGTGKGYSVLDIINAGWNASNKAIKTNISDRRPGDPPILVASSKKFMKDSGWKPKFDNIDDIVETVWNWRCKNPNGYS